MRTSEVISSLQQRGIVLKIIDGRLKIGGAEKLTDREKAALRAHKSFILRALEPLPTSPAAAASPAPVAVSTAATESPSALLGTGIIGSGSDRAGNRERMPLTASAVDKLRSVFGDGVRVVYAEEGGRELGTPPDPGVVAHPPHVPAKRRSPQPKEDRP